MMNVDALVEVILYGRLFASHPITCASVKFSKHTAPVPSRELLSRRLPLPIPIQDRENTRQRYRLTAVRQESCVIQVLRMEESRRFLKALHQRVSPPL